MEVLSKIQQSWEEQNKVKILSLEPYRHLFPKAVGIDKTIEPNAGVSHTVAFIPEVVKQCAWQVEKYVNRELKGLPLYEACEKLWHFVRYHIEWVKDQQFKEQVRTPRRLIHDGKGDCDCMTTFVDTCMHVYGVKGIVNRITAYEAGHFQHIYSLIPNGTGGYIIIDCCVHKFNYEKPYSKKEDYIMELQLLDGIGENRDAYIGSYADLFGGSDLGELGKLLKKKASSGGGGGSAPAKKPGILKKAIQKVAPKLPPKKTPEKKAAAKAKRKETGKKVLKVVNKVNKINPATVLLRAGILASMKLNIGKVAERIKWGYATPEYAQSKGMDMTKYEKVKSILKKTEQIFFAAGGNAENLKKAILTGKGNHNHEVSGTMEGLHENMGLAELLGAIYSDEFINGMEGFDGFGYVGFGQLGEPATATSIAAASTAMGTLAALLHAIGDLFPKRNKENSGEGKKGLFKKKQASSEDPAAEDAADSSEPTTEEIAPSENEAPAQEEAPSEETPAEANEEPSSEAEMETTLSEDVPSEETPGENEEGTDGLLSGPFTGLTTFYKKNKGWIVPVGIAGGCLLLASGIYLMTKGSDSTQVRAQVSNNGFNGPGKKRGRKKKSERLSPTKKVLALM